MLKRTVIIMMLITLASMVVVAQEPEAPAGELSAMGFVNFVSHPTFEQVDTAANEAVVTRAVEMLNAKAFDCLGGCFALNAVYADGIVMHDTLNNTVARGLPALNDLWLQRSAEFTAFQVKDVAAVPIDDLVWVVGDMHFTRSNQLIAYPVLLLARVTDGKVAEEWWLYGTENLIPAAGG